MNNTFDPLIIGPQLLFGYLVKHWPILKSWPNRLIPIFNFILGILIEFSKSVANADDGKTTGQPWWMKLLYVLINTFISSGVHGTVQSTVDHVSGKPYPKSK